MNHDDRKGTITAKPEEHERARKKPMSAGSLSSLALFHKIEAHQSLARCGKYLAPMLMKQLESGQTVQSCGHCIYC